MPEKPCQRSLSVLVLLKVTGMQCKLTAKVYPRNMLRLSRALRRSTASYLFCRDYITDLKPRLSKSRRKRTVPNGWATSEQVESYTVVKTSELLYSGASALAVEPSAGQEVIVGTSIYSLERDEKISELSINGKVTDSVWCGGLAVISSTSGEIKAFNKGQEVHSLTTHAGEANGLAVHPSGEFLVSVGVDKSFVFYDMSTGQSLNQVFADSGKPFQVKLMKTIQLTTQ